MAKLSTTFDNTDHQFFLDQLFTMVKLERFVVACDEFNLERLIQNKGSIRMQMWFRNWLNSDDRESVANQMNERLAAA